MRNSILLIIFASLFIVSCKPDAFKPVGDASVFRIQSLSGNWTVSSVVQTDEDAIRKGFPYKTLDVTNDYTFKTFKLNLLMSGDAPGNFTIDKGTAPNFFRHTTGKWSVDDLKLPTKLYLINGTDTVKINISNYSSLAANQLKIKLLKSAYGKTQIGYDYLFTK